MEWGDLTSEERGWVLRRFGVAANRFADDVGDEYLRERSDEELDRRLWAAPRGVAVGPYRFFLPGSPCYVETSAGGPGMVNIIRAVGYPM